MHRITGLVVALSVAAGLVVTALPHEADACGIKLTIKTPKRLGMRERIPTRTMGDRTVVAAQPDRKPIAAGPTATPPRTIVARKDDPPPVAIAPPTNPTPPTPPVTPPTPPPEVTTNPTPPPPETRPVPVKPTAPVRTEAWARTEVYFGLNRSAASDGMTRQFARTVRYLNAHADARITVEGHADPSGRADKNLELSQARADAVKDLLVGKGIDSGRIDVKALGDTQPKYGRADGRNRRVVVDLVK